MLDFNRLQRLIGSTMYRDTVTVTRQVPCLDDEGADDYEMKDVYTDIPCKLSQASKPTMEKTDSTVVIGKDWRLYLALAYEIQANDVIKVTHEGVTYLFNTATPFKYPTHQEVTLSRKDDA